MLGEKIAFSFLPTQAKQPVCVREEKQFYGAFMCGVKVSFFFSLLHSKLRQQASYLYSLTTVQVHTHLEL